MLCLKAELLGRARAIVERPVTALIAPNFQIRKVPPCQFGAGLTHEGFRCGDIKCLRAESGRLDGEAACARRISAVDI